MLHYLQHAADMGLPFRASAGAPARTGSSSHSDGGGGDIGGSFMSYCDTDGAGDSLTGRCRPPSSLAWASAHVYHLHCRNLPKSAEGENICWDWAALLRSGDVWVQIWWYLKIF